MELKSAELVVRLDSIVTLTHSERQYSSLHLTGSKLQHEEGTQKQLKLPRKINVTISCTPEVTSLIIMNNTNRLSE